MGSLPVSWIPSLYAAPSPQEAASGPYYRDTAVAVRRFTDAEVGDSQKKIFYTLIRSGLASLCILLLGNIFRFRAISYVIEDRNYWFSVSMKDC